MLLGTPPLTPDADRAAHAEIEPTGPNQHNVRTTIRTLIRDTVVAGPWVAVGQDQAADPPPDGPGSIEPAA